MMSSVAVRPANQTHPLADNSAPAETEGYQELQIELEHRLLVLVDLLRARIADLAAELGLTPSKPSCCATSAARG